MFGNVLIEYYIQMLGSHCLSYLTENNMSLVTCQYVTT